MQEITLDVYGVASKRKIATLKVNKLELTLLEFLEENDIPIASSCSGNGICKKCVIQNQILTCEITVGHFLKANPEKEIRVDYL